MFGYTLVKSPQNLNDLNAVQGLSSVDFYRRAKILVVDDTDFDQIETLKGRDYQIKKVDDIQDLSQAEPYDIVLIDIKGVGKAFNSPHEGAYVAKALKETYPNKRIIMITGSKYEDKYNSILKIIDGYLNKDSSTEEWEELIRENVEKVANPVKQWKTIRNRLLDCDVGIHLVYELEQVYITAIKQKSPKIFEDSRVIKSLSPAVRQVVTSLVKSVVFQVLK